MKTSVENRLLVLTFIFIFAGLLIWGRFFFLSVIYHDYYVARVNSAAVSNAAPRGSIFLTDKDSLPYAAALNKEFPLIFAAPSKVKEPEVMAEKLAGILDLDKEFLIQKLSKPDDPYEILKKKVSDEIVDVIKSEKFTGIGIDEETNRYYPEGLFLSHVIGFLGFNQNGQAGQYGLEEYYDKELAGISRGNDLILTIDSAIQVKAGGLLAEAISKWNADGGSIIVMNPKNGDILAMTSLPDFDANRYSEIKDKGIFINPATQNLFEPGSVFKPLTMAIGLETGAVTPETEYNNTGSVVVGGRLISNSITDKNLGLQTMTKVLEQSLNTGAVFVAQKVPKNVFLKYLESFGIDGKTGIDIPEVGGNLSNLESGRDINFATASFGQGVALTPLALIRSLSVIAGGGRLIKPHLSVNAGKSDAPEVISAETAAKLTSMMIKVVENGSGKRASVDGYTIAGKTGTAQIPDLKKGGYLDEYIHSFVGFAPAYDPKFIALIKIDNPKNIRFAESTAVPVFHDLASFIFSYLQIPPDKANE